MISIPLRYTFWNGFAPLVYAGSVSSIVSSLPKRTTPAQVLVGASTVSNDNKDEHRRLDRVSTLWKITAATTLVTNPLGGGLYMMVPYMKELGVVYNHVFSAVGAFELSDGTRLVRLRNPWGEHGEWKGDWSDGSRLWDKRPDAVEAIGDKGKVREGDDGAFFIAHDDFVKRFATIDFCRIKHGKCRTPYGHMHARFYSFTSSCFSNDTALTPSGEPLRWKRVSICSRREGD